MPPRARGATTYRPPLKRGDGLHRSDRLVEVVIELADRRALDRYRLDVPDVAAILADRTIGRELSGSRRVQDRHPRPDVAVAIGVAHAPLAFDVGSKVREHQVRVVVHEPVQQRLEQLGVAAREEAATNEVDDGRELDVAPIPVVWPVTRAAQVLDLARRRARTRRNCRRRLPCAARRSHRRACRS